jgi:hypothetical protein
MGEPGQLLRDAQKQTQADDPVLIEARKRRNATLTAACRHSGVIETYYCGSVACALAIHPVLDADGGIILDRRRYPTLGPDGDDEAPTLVVADLQAVIGPELRRTWPNAVVKTMKRGLRIFFNDPLADGQDPYVDLVVAMKRKDALGLWIPNMDVPRWDPSHPQRHVELFLSGTKPLRRTRAQTIRLAKVWNGQFSQPALSSFNIGAEALLSITEVAAIEEALFTFFDEAAANLAIRRTDDPAGVSGPIHLEQSKDVVVKRLGDARDHLRRALDNADDPDVVGDALHQVFWKYLPAVTDTSKVGLARLLSASTPRLRTTAAGVAVAGSLKSPRSFGGNFHG